MIEKYSCHLFSDKNKLPFKAEDYSKFKYGAIPQTRAFASDLAHNFVEDKLLELYNKIGEFNIIVISSPYIFIPNAAALLREYFTLELNNILYQINKSPARELKMHRDTTYDVDYSKMTKEDRELTMGNEKFYVDKNYIKDSVVIFLDDIKITGGHHDHIIRTIKEQGLEEVTKHIYTMYFAELTNNTIDPNIEYELNHSFVQDSLKLLEIMQPSIYRINTRVVKFLLGRPLDEFEKFCITAQEYYGMFFLYNLYSLIVSNKYYAFEKHEPNFNFLKSVVY